MLNRLKTEPVYNDRLVIIDENGTADIANIIDQDDMSLTAESSSYDYNVPLADVQSYVGSVGRIYVMKAESEYISETKRLAALEKSIVLRQVTHFERERDEKKKIDLKQILMYAAVGILLLAVIFK